MKVAALVVGGIILYKLILARTRGVPLFSTKFTWTRDFSATKRQLDTAIQAYGG